MIEIADVEWLWGVGNRFGFCSAPAFATRSRSPARRASRDLAIDVIEGEIRSAQHDALHEAERLVVSGFGTQTIAKELRKRAERTIRASPTVVIRERGRQLATITAAVAKGPPRRAIHRDMTHTRSAELNRASLEELLTRGLEWSPTRALAEEATAQLRSNSTTRTVTTSRTYRVLPVEHTGPIDLFGADPVFRRFGVGPGRLFKAHGWRRVQTAYPSRERGHLGEVKRP